MLHEGSNGNARHALVPAQGNPPGAVSRSFHPAPTLGVTYTAHQDAVGAGCPTSCHSRESDVRSRAADLISSIGATAPGYQESDPYRLARRGVAPRCSLPSQIGRVTLVLHAAPQTGRRSGPAGCPGRGPVCLGGRQVVTGW